VKEPLWQRKGLKGSSQNPAYLECIAGHLQNDGVSSQKGHDHLRKGYRKGIIPGRNDAHHPIGLVDQRTALIG
jgi:hypothetical protein